MRRLTRAEYDRTVGDLLATPRRPGEAFPADPAADGFDTVAAAASTSSLLVQLYEQAAATLAADVVRDPWPPDPRPVKQRDSMVTSTPDRIVEDEAGTGLLGGFRGTGRLALGEPGVYEIRITLSARDAAMSVRLTADGAPLATVRLLPGRPEQIVSGRVTTVGATVALGIEVDDAGTRQGVAVFGDPVGQGPLFDAGNLSATRARVLPCDLDGDDPRTCAHDALAAVGRRALRRAVQPIELDAWMAAYDAIVAGGSPPAWGFEAALRQILLDPWFLFLVEERAPAGGDPVAVDGFTLASRLSYLLWGSMPDDALLDRAEAGALADPDALAAEAARMLADPRAAGFVEDFLGQWLGLRLLDDAQPDVEAWPRFDEDLRASMRGELSRLLGSFVGSGRDVRELVRGPDVWVDARLAAFYGLDAPASGFEPRDGAAIGRGGVLATGALLTGLSYPTRTSPVRRGAWVLSQLLCDPPDPPPPGVPTFPAATESSSTVRARLAEHRQDPVCASCHDAMDPVGLAFEHFDGIGAWRDHDEGGPVDATGAAPDGTPVDGLAALAAHVADDPRFAPCVVDRLFTHAMRRAPTDDDAATLAALGAAFVGGGHALDALVEALVRSDAFRLRRPEAP